MYICYECLICRIVFIIPTEDVERMLREGKYISCNFGHKKIKELNKYDDLKKCSEHRSYTKVNGRVRQRL